MISTFVLDHLFSPSVSSKTQHLSGQSSKPILSLCVSLCECASASILRQSGLFIYGGLTEEQDVLSIPAKAPLHDRGEEVNELLFVFHLTLEMLSQCVPGPWLEWAGKAYISRRLL